MISNIVTEISGGCETGVKTPEIQIEQTKGHRRRMEDRSRVVIRPEGIFAGVFDGHGGASVVELVAGCLPKKFFAHICSGLSAPAAFESAFLETDRDSLASECGSTAACAFLTGNRLTIANVGDTAVMVVGSDVRSLTRSHRLDDAGELARITATGARVEYPYYYSHTRGIVPTRSFGDSAMRPFGLISTPHIAEYDLSHTDRYILIASDGLVEVLRDADIAEILSGNPPAEEGAKALVRTALDQGSTDNISVILIRLT